MEEMEEGTIDLIVTSPPYDDSLQYKAADIVSTCLPEGMYDFIIYDVYGDGM